MIILLSCALMVEYSTSKQVFCVNLYCGSETVMALSSLLDARASRFCTKLMASRPEIDAEVSEVIVMLDS